MSKKERQKADAASGWLWALIPRGLLREIKIVALKAGESNEMAVVRVIKAGIAVISKAEGTVRQ